ncbi:MAG: hypothetical protein NZ960_02075 [Candidatus Kapabacteria bacterium]|nr:hypothetical protein [Candidatus Kapabacteria bacterium]MDW8011812.1 hypothetical protein [Bacteroidota bacterium]
MAAAVIEVFVCRAFSGQILRLQLPAQHPIQDFLGQLAEQLQLSADVDSLGLYNLTQNFEYLRTDTLADRGTRAGDLLLLAPGGTCNMRR